MPNHVINELIFSDCDADKVQRLREVICDEYGKVDFEVLLPSPINIWRGCVGSKHKETFPDTHLDWATKNWGTKWNAYGDRAFEVDGGTVTVTFRTAWNPPYGWLVALFNTIKGKFSHNFLSEGRTKAVVSSWNYVSIDQAFGDAWVEIEADEEMQKHLHILLWGCESFDEETA